VTSDDCPAIERVTAAERQVLVNWIAAVALQRALDDLAGAQDESADGEGQPSNLNAQIPAASPRTEAAIARAKGQQRRGCERSPGSVVSVHVMKAVFQLEPDAITSTERLSC
jgi:hypothetical protein